MAIKLDWSGRNFTQEVAAATPLNSKLESLSDLKNHSGLGERCTPSLEKQTLFGTLFSHRLGCRSNDHPLCKTMTKRKKLKIFCLLQWPSRIPCSFLLEKVVNSENKGSGPVT